MPRAKVVFRKNTSKMDGEPREIERTPEHQAGHMILSRYAETESAPESNSNFQAALEIYIATIYCQGLQDKSA